MKNPPLMKLDLDKYLYIGCIPVRAQKDMPPDQSKCIKEICPNCNGAMWVSEKKLLVRKQDPKRNVIYCLLCIAFAAYNQGYDMELFDISKVIK